MARRMALASRLLVRGRGRSAAALGASCPCSPAAQRRARSRTRSSASSAQIGAKKGHERVLTTRHRGLHAAGSTRCRATSPAADAGRCGSQTDLDAKRAELARIQERLRQERLRLDAAARPARRGARRARRAPGRALQGRPARHRHRRPRVRRLRRPARAHRVHAARLRARTRGSSTRVSDRQGGRDRDRQAARQAREARSRRSPTAIAAPARRGRPPSRASSSTAADARSGARSSKSRALASHARPPPRARGRRRRAARPSRRRSQRAAGRRGACSGARDAPARSSQGSGGLIWPVNGPITSPFCESRAWESCHPGIDIGVPAGTPIRAAAAGTRRADAGRGARAATATSPASSTRRRSPRATRTSRASATSHGRERQPGPGHRLRRAAPAAASAPTCTSRRGSTACRREPDELPLGQRRRGGVPLPEGDAARDPHLRPAPSRRFGLHARRSASWSPAWLRRAAPEGARPAASTGPTRWSSPR